MGVSERSTDIRFRGKSERRGLNEEDEKGIVRGI